MAGAAGYFLGDYQGLIGVGNVLMPVFLRANDGNVSNRTDVFTSRVDATSTIAGSSVSIAGNQLVEAVSALRADPLMRQAVSDNITHKLRERRRVRP